MSRAQAKSRFREGKQFRLDQLIRSPKKWWAEVRKFGLIDGIKELNLLVMISCMMKEV